MSLIGIKFVDGGRVFNCENETLELNIRDKVVVESIRGLEIAEVCTPSSDDKQEEVKSVVRLATAEDFQKAQELKKNIGKVKNITNELIAKYQLEMKLVDVNFTLDGMKVIINYVCEDRVDFRDLVKDLASQLKLRIELRQIGIRDQAKILGGIGFCGKECCCKKYLNDFDKVSIKMAKTQGLSLNPTKISGICGRLMCCLSYENELYSEVASIMPKLNSRVKTKDGIGNVIYNNLLKQKVTVKIECDNEVKISEYDVKDIEVLAKTNIPNNPNKNSNEKDLSKDNRNNKPKDNKSKDNKPKDNTEKVSSEVEKPLTEPVEKKNFNNKFKYKNKKKNKFNNDNKK